VPIAVCFILILAIAAMAQSMQPDSLSSDRTALSQSDTIANKDPSGAMLRSLAVPGWGQFYNGKWFKGIVIGGAEVGLVANAIVLNQWAKEAESEDERYFYLDNRNLSFWILGATILYSMADAYVDAHLYNFDESPELTFFLQQQSEPLVGISASIMTMRLSFRF
jgi:hypothetical protein